MRTQHDDGGSTTETLRHPGLIAELVAEPLRDPRSPQADDLPVAGAVVQVAHEERRDVLGRDHVVAAGKASFVLECQAGWLAVLDVGACRDDPVEGAADQQVLCTLVIDRELEILTPLSGPQRDELAALLTLLDGPR